MDSLLETAASNNVIRCGSECGICHGVRSLGISIAGPVGLSNAAAEGG